MKIQNINNTNNKVAFGMIPIGEAKDLGKLPLGLVFDLGNVLRAAHPKTQDVFILSARELPKGHPDHGGFETILSLFKKSQKEDEVQCILHREDPFGMNEARMLGAVRRLKETLGIKV